MKSNMDEFEPVVFSYKELEIIEQALLFFENEFSLVHEDTKSKEEKSQENKVRGVREFVQSILKSRKGE
jgi:hypothetical protein